MTAKDVLRSQVIAQVLEEKLDQASAARRLGISVRQVKRLKRRMLDKGTEGLLSRKRGKPSNRRTPADVLENAMALVSVHYADFGPTLACERCCLLVFIDDATGELMALRFVDAETTLGYMALLEEHVLAHGLPAAIYSDRHSIFQVNRGDYKDVSHAQTQFARALEQLGIEGIQANSPQAKGRVERANQTLQDRLIKEMRLQGISSQEAANAWLPQFIRAVNRRFAVVPATQDDAHIPFAGTHAALRRILSVHTRRRLSGNLSCQLDGMLYQVQATGQGLALRGADVDVVTHPASATELLWQGRVLPHTCNSKPIKQREAVDAKDVNTKVKQALTRRTPPQPMGHHGKNAWPPRPAQRKHAPNSRTPKPTWPQSDLLPRRHFYLGLANISTCHLKSTVFRGQSSASVYRSLSLRFADFNQRR